MKFDHITRTTMHLIDELDRNAHIVVLVVGVAMTLWLLGMHIVKQFGAP